MEFLNKEKDVVLDAPAVNKLLIRIVRIFHVMPGGILNNFIPRREAMLPVLRDNVFMINRCLLQRQAAQNAIGRPGYKRAGDDFTDSGLDNVLLIRADADPDVYRRTVPAVLIKPEGQNRQSSGIFRILKRAASSPACDPFSFRVLPKYRPL